MVDIIEILLSLCVQAVIIVAIGRKVLSNIILPVTIKANNYEKQIKELNETLSTNTTRYDRQMKELNDTISTLQADLKRRPVPPKLLAKPKTAPKPSTTDASTSLNVVQAASETSSVVRGKTTLACSEEGIAFLKSISAVNEVVLQKDRIAGNFIGGLIKILNYNKEIAKKLLSLHVHFPNEVRSLTESFSEHYKQFKEKPPYFIEDFKELEDAFNARRQAVLPSMTSKIPNYDEDLTDICTNITELETERDTKSSSSSSSSSSSETIPVQTSTTASESGSTTKDIGSTKDTDSATSQQVPNNVFSITSKTEDELEKQTRDIMIMDAIDTPKGASNSTESNSTKSNSTKSTSEVFAKKRRKHFTESTDRLKLPQTSTNGVLPVIPDQKPMVHSQQITTNRSAINLRSPPICGCTIIGQVQLASATVRSVEQDHPEALSL